MQLPPLPDTAAQVVQPPGAMMDATWYFFFARLLGALSERTTMITSAIEPTTTDIPEGESRVWRNTTAGTVRFYTNSNGTLVSALMS